MKRKIVFFVLVICLLHSVVLDVTFAGDEDVEGPNYDDALIYNEEDNEYYYYVPEEAEIVDFSIGDSHRALLFDDGGLWLSGGSSYGQIGSLDDYSWYTKILSNINHVSLGLNHSAAVDWNGNLWIWGDNREGQVGIEKGNVYEEDYNGRVKTNHQNMPYLLMTDISKVSLGYNASAAITKEGDLYAWGSFLGHYYWDEYSISGPQNKPIKILSGVKDVNVGRDMIVAIKNDGSLWFLCFNQDILNATDSDWAEQGWNKIMDSVIKADAGYKNAAAITADHKLFIWGYYYNWEPGYMWRKQEYYNEPTLRMSGVKNVYLGGEVDILALKDNGSLHYLGYPPAQNYDTDSIKLIDDVREVSYNKGGDDWNEIMVMMDIGDVYCFDTSLDIMTDTFFLNALMSEEDVDAHLEKFNDSKEEWMLKIPIESRPYPFEYLVPDTVISSPVYEVFSYDLEHYIRTTQSTDYSPDLSHFLLAMNFCTADDNLDYVRRQGFEDCSWYQCDFPGYIGEDAYWIGTRRLTDNTGIVFASVRGEKRLSDVIEDSQTRVWTSDRSWFTQFDDEATDLFENIKITADSLYEQGVEKIHYVITGYSLGAAVANLAEVYLSDSGVPKEDIYAYNFATPDIGRNFPDEWNKDGKYDNIFNICNAIDPIPRHDEAVNYIMDYIGRKMGTIYASRREWGKYGRTLYFANDWNELNDVTLINEKTYQDMVAEGKEYDALEDALLDENGSHGLVTYLNFIRREEDINYFKDWEDIREEIKSRENRYIKYRIISVFCPVDVSILDEEDNEIIVLRNNEIVVDNPTSEGRRIIPFIEGDKKIFLIDVESDVNLKLTGTDQGKMEYAIADYDWDTGEIINEKVFENVELEAGKQMTSSIIDISDNQEIKLFVTDDSGEDVAEVLEDGTEVPLITGIPGDVNKDTKVNFQDVTTLLKHVKKKPLDKVDLKAVDVDGNGKVNFQDVTALLKYVKKKVNTIHYDGKKYLR